MYVQIKRKRIFVGNNGRYLEMKKNILPFEIFLLFWNVIFFVISIFHMKEKTFSALSRKWTVAIAMPRLSCVKQALDWCNFSRQSDFRSQRNMHQKDKYKWLSKLIVQNREKNWVKEPKQLINFYMPVILWTHLIVSFQNCQHLKYSQKSI